MSLRGRITDDDKLPFTNRNKYCAACGTTTFRGGIIMRLVKDRETKLRNKVHYCLSCHRAGKSEPLRRTSERLKLKNKHEEEMPEPSKKRKLITNNNDDDDDTESIVGQTETKSEKVPQEAENEKEVETEINLSLKIFYVETGSATLRERWDVYDSFVVCCKNEEDARKIHPGGRDVTWLTEDEKFHKYNSWISPKEIHLLKVTCIGEANPMTTKKDEIICSSFNAG